MRRALAFAAPIAASLLAATAARAEPEEAAPHAAPPEELDGMIDRRVHRTWHEGIPRAFLATQIDAGYLYLRPRASAGWGLPYYTWVGVDANPIVTATTWGAYAGVRGALPFADLRVGSRYLGSWSRRYLAPQDAYTRFELESTSGGGLVRTLSHEAELDTAIPLGSGRLLALGSSTYVTNVPDGSYAFEDTLRVIVAPPWVFRGRVGYAFPFPGVRAISIAPVVDALYVPKRDDGLTIRGGLLMRASLSRHLELRGAFVPTLKSPDSIGLAGSDFTELGIRFRWATGLKNRDEQWLD
jgi:hypothetical protein